MAFGTRKTGLPSVKSYVRKACSLLFQFDPVIQLLFADKPLLLSAIATFKLACDELVKQIDDTLDPGV